MALVRCRDVFRDPSSPPLATLPQCPQKSGEPTMYKAFDMGVRAKESTSKTASTLNESKRSKVGSLYKKRSRGVR